MPVYLNATCGRGPQILMSLTTPFPEPDSPELERFAIYSRSEIAGLLRQLRDRQVLVTLYYDQAAGFTVSNVLDVNEGFEELILDRTSDAAAQKAIYASKQLVVVAFLDNVKVQFSVGAAEAVEHQGRPAFRVRLPQQLLRMQRRGVVSAPAPQRPSGHVSGAFARKKGPVRIGASTRLERRRPGAVRAPGPVRLAGRLHAGKLLSGSSRYRPDHRHAARALRRRLPGVE